MKKLSLIIAIVSCVTIIYAQDNEPGSKKPDEIMTLFGGKPHGFYLGLGAGYSTIDNKSAVTLNLRSGVLLGHWLSLGLGGSGFVNQPKNDSVSNRSNSLAGGYGGIYIEPIVFPRLPVHLSFPILVGGGAIAYTDLQDNHNQNDQVNQNPPDNNHNNGNSQIFFLVEPAAELEFNFSHWCRVAAYVSYRFTTKLDWPESSSYALNNFSSGVIFKFGKF